MVWNSRRDSRKRLCFIHVTVKNCLGFTLQDCNRVMEHPRFLLFTRSTSVGGCCSRIERKARKIAECTSYTPCDLLSFSSEDGKRSEKDRRVYLLHSLCLTLIFSGGSGAWTGHCNTLQHKKPWHRSTTRHEPSLLTHCNTLQHNVLYTAHTATHCNTKKPYHISMRHAIYE